MAEDGLERVPPFARYSDVDLVETVRGHEGVSPKGQAAQAELVRRLTLELRESSRIAAAQTKRLTWLTWALLFVTVVLLVVAVAQLRHLA